MSGTALEDLAASIRLQVANRQLQRAPDLAWAERILERKGRGEQVGYHAAKEAAAALRARDQLAGFKTSTTEG